MEGDNGIAYKDDAQIVFLSTPSGWRATSRRLLGGLSVSISIHALRVEGDPRLYAAPAPQRIISIHALRVEGDQGARLPNCTIRISIHALRVEGDSKNGQSFRLFLRKREKNLPL